MKWISGTVLRKLGPVVYHVDVGKGQVRKQHVDQLRHRGGELQQPAIPPVAGPTKSSVMDEDFYLFEQDAPPPEEDAPPLEGDAPPRYPPADTDPPRDSPAHREPPRDLPADRESPYP